MTGAGVLIWAESFSFDGYKAVIEHMPESKRHVAR